MSGESSKKVYTTVVFIISLLIFIFSLFPGMFFMSAVGLTGTAGVPDDPSSPSAAPINMDIFDSGISIVSGVVSILSAAYGIQLTRSEFAKLKAAQIDRDMQIREIEKLRLELELEKEKEAKRKQRAKEQSKAKKKAG
jgi:hypothetical protein